MEIYTFNNSAFLAIFLWLIGLFFIIRDKKIKSGLFVGNLFVILGIIVIIGFIIKIWVEIDRPPLRTLGETRLWYALFLSMVGVATFARWKFKWFLYYSLGLAIMFLVINIMKPENFDKTLMPALQSPWFVPHVIVYMLSYALLGVSSLISIWGLYLLKYRTFKSELLDRADNLVYMGFALLTLGMLFGALWAKVAWGHYWSWDPKETWALLTWLCYLLYIHLRFKHKQKVATALWVLALAFIVMMICWVGINYMSVGMNSVHTYG